MLVPEFPKAFAVKVLLRWFAYLLRFPYHVFIMGIKELIIKIILAENIFNKPQMLFIAI